MLIPLYVVFTQLFGLNIFSLKFIGEPFFKTFFAFTPDICNTALDYEISVIAKS